MIRKEKNPKKQQKTLSNIHILFNGRNDSIKFIEDYGSVILEAKRKATEGIGLNILTTKQILQRLPIVLAQLKAGNNSEDFTKWNQTNCLFSVSVKINYLKSK